MTSKRTSSRDRTLSNELKKERRRAPLSIESTTVEWARVDDEFRSKNEVATVRYIRNQSSK